MSKSRLTVPVPKPRNPVALPARQRRAGAHRRGTGANRLAELRALRKELKTEYPPPTREAS